MRKGEEGDGKGVEVGVGVCGDGGLVGWFVVVVSVCGGRKEGWVGGGGEEEKRKGTEEGRSGESCGICRNCGNGVAERVAGPSRQWCPDEMGCLCQSLVLLRLLLAPATALTGCWILPDCGSCRSHAGNKCVFSRNIAKATAPREPGSSSSVCSDDG